ncbi:MAG: class I adenylate-forming enzyme family protein [Acidobacteriota bacterium]
MFLEHSVGHLVEPLTGRRWDPSEVRRQVLVRAAALAREGVEQGDRLFLHHGNRLEIFADLLASWRLGACPIPLDRRLTPYQVGVMAEAAQPRLHVIDEQASDELRESFRATEVETDALGEETVVAETEATRSPVPHLDDEALILFTSGSTGEPKGVVHTHRSLRARWSSLAGVLDLEAHRRTLCFLPTHFGHGLICNALFPWLHGQDLFITPPMSPLLAQQLGRLIDDHQITFLSSVPSAWRLALRLSKAPEGGSLQRVHVGSAPLSAALWCDVQAWAGTRDVRNTYGITETGSWVAGLTDPDVTPEDGLIGHGWGSRIRVLRTTEPSDAPPEDVTCEAGEVGQVWLDTPALMRGYWQRPDLTDAVVREGWFLTGDLGLLDERGRLHLKGRERDEINKGGTKVHPADIDAVVERFAGVTDNCAFGYADPLLGENVGLAVVLADHDRETVRGLHAWLESHLADHQRPMRWYLLDEIPRTSRGKINRATVEKTCAERDPLDLPSYLGDDSSD